MYLARMTILKGENEPPVERGDVVQADEFGPAKLQQLLDRRALIPVEQPPLTALPGWKTRGEKLKAIGVLTVADYLKADEKDLLVVLGGSAQRLARYRSEIEGHLKPSRKTTASKKSAG